MIGKFIRQTVLLVTLLLSWVGLHAQSEVLVTGKVTSSVDDGPLAGVDVYVFKTVGAGEYEFERAKLMYETGYVPEGLVKNVMSRQDGEYEITVPAYGALIFYRHPFKPVLVKVRGKNRHDVVIEATQMITDAILVEKGKKQTKKGKVVGYGNNYAVKNFPYFFKMESMGEVESITRENSRLVTQMFLMTADGKDTLTYFPPRVYDGAQFHQTQYHWNRNALYDIAETYPQLELGRDSLMFNVKFEVEHPDQLYFCKANIWLEDYIKVYYRDTVELLNTGRVSRPFQFLDYAFASSKLDPQKYYKEPRREMIATPKDMKLKFKVDSDQLDMNDRATREALDSLKAELKYISLDPASMLREIHFRGFSSPEGSYDKNFHLSQRRTQTVMNNVLSSLPKADLPRIYRTSAGAVSTWEELAVLLDRDSLENEAAHVREIIRMFPKDIGAQGKKIRTLKEYRDLIVPRLSELRVVRCEYLAEVSRFLTPEEILERYNTDEDFRTGKKILTLNEYWHLFRLIKDKKELESLYRRALEASYKAEREYWALPANNLAELMLERKQMDTLLLKPFINENRPINYSEMDINTGQRRFINDEAVVVNQMLMYMLAKNYSRAEEVSYIISETHPMLRAIVRCMGGYLDLSDPSDLKLVEEIRDSSPRNKVIINLFSEVYDSTTVEALKRLPPEEPLTSYLKAQRLCLQYSNQAILMRGADFNRDEDMSFRHPKDKEMPAATEEEMEAVRKSIADLESEVQAYKELGLLDEVAMVEKDIKREKDMLEGMINKEPVITPAQCSVYEAAYIYLKNCFEKDKKFILTAKADADINEDLLNDILGITKEKK